MKQDKIKYNRVDKGWDQMSLVLDKEMPQKKRRYGLIILFLGLFLASVFGYYTVSSNLISDNQDMANFEEQADIKLSKSEKLNPAVQENSSQLNEAIVDDNRTVERKETSNTKDPIIDLADNTEINKTDVSHQAVILTAAKKSLVLDNETANESTVQEKLPLAEDPKIETELVENALADKNIGAESKSIFNPPLVLTSLEKIQALSVPTLLYDRSLKPSNKLSELPISIKPKSRDWSFNALALIEHIPNFNSTGYGLGLGIDRRISAKWSASLRLAYMRNTRSLNPARMALEADMPLNEQDMQGGNISGFLSARNLEENTDQLNSISLGAHLSYNLSGSLAISTGLTIERYFKRLDLRPSTPDELALNQMEQYVVQENSELIPNFELGIAYSFNARFGVFAAFRKSLKDFYADESDVLSTSKLMAGVKYSF